MHRVPAPAGHGAGRVATLFVLLVLPVVLAGCGGSDVLDPWPRREGDVRLMQAHLATWEQVEHRNGTITIRFYVHNPSNLSFTTWRYMMGVAEVSRDGSKARNLGDGFIHRASAFEGLGPIEGLETRAFEETLAVGKRRYPDGWFGFSLSIVYFNTINEEFERADYTSGCYALDKPRIDPPPQGCEETYGALSSHFDEYPPGSDYWVQRFRHCDACKRGHP